MRRISGSLLLFLAAGFSGAPLSHASLVSYTSLASWTANANGISNIDFENITPDGTFTQNPSFTVSGVKFEGYVLSQQSTLPIVAVDSHYHPNPAPFPTYAYDRGTGDSLQGPNGDPFFTFVPGSGTPGSGILVTLPGGGSTAVGADFWAFYFEKTLLPTATFEVTFFSGATNLGVFDFNTLSYPGVQFFGVTSTSPITSLFVQSLGGATYIPSGETVPQTAPSTWVELDNFTYGTAATGVTVVNPEPSTLILLSGALVGLWFRRRSLGA